MSRYYCDNLRHLICVPYSVQNLHAMAEDLEIKRHWFHGSAKYAHYDIPKRRVQEIQADSRVTVVRPREILKLIKTVE